MYKKQETAVQHPLMERINLCFLLSGFCSLLYQTVWLRVAVARFGVNAPIIASVLSVFMLGLGLGNLLGSRYQAHLNTTRLLTGLRGYALLELVVSMGGLLVPAMMSYGASAILSVPMTNGAYFVLCFLIILIVLVPFCAAMGATFPVALSFFGNSEESQNTSRFSQLYFANVSGAIYGAVVPAFVALEWLGFQKTIYLAVAANWLIALLVWNAVPAIKPSKDFDTAFRSTGSFLYREPWVLAELFVLGMCSLALEVIWARTYVFFAGAVVYSFAFILAMYLAFTALGTNFYRRRLAGGNFDIAKLWIGLAPAALLVLASIHPALEIAPMLRIFIGVAPISFLLGVVTPSLIDKCTHSEPYKVSIAYTFNLAGCIVGPLVAGFLIIPSWGNRVASYLVAIAFLMTSLFHQFLEKRKNPTKPVRLKFALFAALAVSGMIVVLDKPLESRFANAQVLYDHTATVIASGSGMEKGLIVEGAHMTSLSVMTKMFAHVPLAFLDHEPEQGAVICFGMGTTFRSMTMWKIRTTAVELVPSVPKFFPFFFPDAPEILERPNATILIDDGRRFLSRGTEKFDVIVADPPPPVESVSSGLLYSVEFYEIVKKRLKANGIFGTIILSSDSQNLFSMVMALKQSFRYVRLFEPYGEHNIYQVVASESPIPNRNAEELTRRMPEDSKKDLTEWIDSTPRWFPDTVQGMYQQLLDTEIDIADFLGKHEPWQRIPLTDDKPVNEYFFLRRTILGGWQ
jgi:spermidine synthase